MHDDQPYLTRREKERLRTKKKEYLDKNPDSAPYIEKGILYAKDDTGTYMEVDKFNLENQIFNKQNYNYNKKNF